MNEATAQHMNPRRILIVEDNLDVLEPLVELLRIIGHDVEGAPDGPTALDVAERFGPDIVLCDIGLPPPMDGFAVAAALRERNHGRRLWLAALTGYTRAEDRERSRQAGFDAHLAKPVDLDQVEALIQQFDG